MAHSSAAHVRRSPRPSLQPRTIPPAAPFSAPSTQSSATSSPSRSHPSLPHGSCNSELVGRKRTRHNDFTSKSNFTTPQREALQEIDNPPAESASTHSSGTESPMPFTNSKYLLAGGLDTPAVDRLDWEERHEMSLRELDYRPNRLTFMAREEVTKLPRKTTASFAGRGPSGRNRAFSAHRPGWGRVVANAVGGVAGRVFNFCWNSAFRGFQAGGGQAYRMDSDTPVLVQQASWMDMNEKDDVFDRNLKRPNSPSMALTPGQFPENGFINDYMLHPQVHQMRELQHLGLSTELRTGSPKGNWIIVDRTGGTTEIPRSPNPSLFECRQTKQPYQDRPNSGSLAGAPDIRSGPSFAGSPGPCSSQTASIASPRGSPRRTGGRVAEVSPKRIAGHRVSRSSAASPRQKLESGPRPSYNAATSPDVQRFEKRIRRQERKEDENIQRLNKQLQDMIKQGKQALRTTIEVEDDSGEDGSYGEDAEAMSVSRWGETS